MEHIISDIPRIRESLHFLMMYAGEVVILRNDSLISGHIGFGQNFTSEDI